MTDQEIKRAMQEDARMMERAKEIIHDKKSFLMIPAYEFDGDNDLYLEELLCEEEFDSIMELIDSCLERKIYREKLKIREYEDEERNNLQRRDEGRNDNPH